MITLIVGDFLASHHVKNKKGDVVSASATVMTSGGVGYEVHFSLKDMAWLEAEFIAGRRRVTAATRWVWSESAGPKVFGFVDETVRRFFDRLLEVDGIGGGRALEIVGFINEAAFTALVNACDVKALVKVPGIGAKGAQKLLEVWR